VSTDRENQRTGKCGQPGKRPLSSSGPAMAANDADGLLKAHSRKTPTDSEARTFDL